MLKRFVAIFAVGLMLSFNVAPALANDNHDEHHCPKPGGGPAFGKHVSEHAHHCPLEHKGNTRKGKPEMKFGICVSKMAHGECPHHDHHDGHDNSNHHDN